MQNEQELEIQKKAHSPRFETLSPLAVRIEFRASGAYRFHMSRVVEFSKAGGPEVLRFKNVDVPEAGPGQVRIRVKAIGLNRAESMWREDKYIEPVKFPARLGYEAVGTVDSVGKDVTTIAVGDEVNTIPSFSMNQYGMYGEVVRTHPCGG